MGWFEIMIVGGCVLWLVTSFVHAWCYDKKRQTPKIIITLLFLAVIPASLIGVGVFYVALSGIFGGIAYKNVFLGISANTDFVIAWMSILASFLMNFAYAFMVYYENKHELWNTK